MIKIVTLPNLMKASLFALLSLLTATASLGVPKASTKDEALEKLIPQFEKKINQIMKANGIPGAAVAIVSRDKVYYLQTFGVKRLGKKDPIMPNTIFQAASLSKPINATMVGILEEKGKLSVKDPVHYHLPHFNERTNLKSLKICHLMSHSSGIPIGGFNELIDAHAPPHKIVAKLQRTRSIAQPGKHFVYHNAMYGMVGDIITNASGKSLEHTLQQELFGPLGMSSASVGLQALLATENRAHPHVPSARGKYMPVDNYSKAYYAVPAAGGVNASIQDLIPFLQLYLGRPSPIVSKETLKQLTTPYVKNPNAVLRYEARKGVISDTYYGLGWQSMNYGNKKVIYHQGHLKGFRNFIGFVQDDIGIIVLTNAERKHASKIALNFFDLYLKS